jgi:hypothetical protein
MRLLMRRRAVLHRFEEFVGKRFHHQRDARFSGLRSRIATRQQENSQSKAAGF